MIFYSAQEVEVRVSRGSETCVSCGGDHFLSSMKRRKHLTEWECQDLAQSYEGSSPLTQPFSHRQTSRDLNLGLYPWTKNERRARGQTRGSVTHKDCINRSRTPVTEMNAEELPDDVLDQIDDPAMLCEDEENAVSPKLSSNRKRTFTLMQSQSQNSQSCYSDTNEITPSSSSFLEDDDDDDNDDEEMVCLLDLLPSSHYGLLGVTDQDNKSWGHINQFPRELLQCIFSFLPIVDLYKNVSFVCNQWRTLVNDPLFIPWKKLYHQYLVKNKEAMVKVENILKNNGIIKEDEFCVLNLIRYFTNLRSSRTADQKAIMARLRYHHLYPLAAACITNRLPELGDTDETINPWAVFAVIVLLSGTVSDIQKLKRCVLESTVRFTEITEALYCLATLLNAMRQENILISNRIHYNVVYCLYLQENSSVQTKTFPFSFKSEQRPTLNLTNEQKQIINHDIAPGQVVKIMAFAGTGKTSTLIKYAESRPHLRFLYATFNSSIAKHAASLFPGNVKCKTFHSLAFAQTGVLYKDRNKINYSKLTPFSVNFVLPEKKAGFIRAKLVVKTLESFFSSADENIDVEHVPIWCKDTRGNQALVTEEEKLFTVREASKIWREMKLLKETRQFAYKMTPDGYLKLWQLRRPHLTDYDAIFVDEAQDCTPAIMEIVLSQPCGKIFVGDPHQQIYTFRGAVNALCEVPHTHIFYLTQSFRFGAEIAYVGATILDAFKKVQNKTLVGGYQKGTINGQCQEQPAILCRTNSCVFDEAVRVTEGEKPAQIHIIGGPNNFGLSKILDIWILLQPESERERKQLFIQDSYIRMWAKKGGFSALKLYAVSSEDKELEAKISVVEKYRNRVPELVNRIKSCHTDDEKKADFILGTVHKAKGMEFETVQVTDDFFKIPTARHNLERLNINITNCASGEDEWNLLYVAITRAKKNLIMTKSIENIMTLTGEYFLRAELSSLVFKDGPIQCALRHCNNSLLEDAVLTLKKSPIIYSPARVHFWGRTRNLQSATRILTRLDTRPASTLSATRTRDPLTIKNQEAMS
ncbi:hypothetical protein XELAEV_18017864mg [Xenopus laevis]|uniref:F-box DNA helicase 1 n=1 Tax=Xenopus laevis TaxID=8355 RepID=A0A974DD69_XENLA|nr:hypothetical protein XELAEV_18017864mg [Xenopus laevis]